MATKYVLLASHARKEISGPLISAGEKIYGGIACSSTGSFVVATFRSDTLADSKGGITISNDSGKTWTEVTSLPRAAPDVLTSWASVTCSDDGAKIYAHCEAMNDATTGASFPSYIGVYFSGDFGTTWTKVLQTSGATYCTISCSSDGQTAYFAGGKYNYDNKVTTNFGETWNTIQLPAYTSIGKILCSANGVNAIMVGQDATIFTTNNSGLTTTNRNNLASLGYVYGGGIGTAVYATPDLSEVFMFATNTHALYILKTTDMGSTITVNSYFAISENLNAIALAASDDCTKVVSWHGPQGYNATSYIRKSTDSGKTWAPQDDLGVGYWPAFACSADGSVFYAGYGYGSANYSLMDSGYLRKFFI